MGCERAISFSQIIVRERHFGSAQENMILQPDDALTTPAVDDTVPTVQSMSNNFNFDAFILSQYVIYMYINTFVNNRTTSVIRDYMHNFATGIVKHTTSNSASCDKINDRALNEYLSKPLSFEQLDIDQLNVLLARTPIDDVLPQAKEIVILLNIMYGNKPVACDAISVYFPTLTGNASIPVTLDKFFVLRVDSTNYCNIPDPYWKLMLSIDNTLGIYPKAKLMAASALPLDPVELVNGTIYSKTFGEEYGVRFCNFVASLLTEMNMYPECTRKGVIWDNSVRATSQRILQGCILKFCGTGAFIVNPNDTNYAMEYIKDFVDRPDLSKDDSFLVSKLAKAVGGKPSIVMADFLLGSTEALGDEVPEEVTTDPAPKEDDDENPPSEDDADDKPDESAPAEEPELTDDESQEINDNDIDRMDSAPTDQEPSTVEEPGRFFPLASKDEGLDDHLFRLMVLDRVNDLIKNPDPSISPEDLEIARLWCNRWLFIVSIDTVKRLLAQLNSRLLKELEE